VTHLATLRSLLFVPGDSERKIAKALEVNADALILDLEDSVAPLRKIFARDAVRHFLHHRPGGLAAQVWVRINSLAIPEAIDDLAAVVGAGLDGIVVPKVERVSDVQKLAHYLDALEVRAGHALGSTMLIPVTTETALAPFGLGDYATARLPRIVGLTWGAEDLSAALGATTQRNKIGEWLPTYELVRSLCLLAAKGSGVQAIETLYSDYKDSDGLAVSCAFARQEGFTGRIAIHPDQVGIINQAFEPSAEEIQYARLVISAFEAAPEAGAVGLNGRMLDIPHLKQAQRVLQDSENGRKRSKAQ
jgi:citrate lyase subunit beta/citryl-CoA lyase